MGLREDSDGFWVAEIAGELAGITLAWVRGSLWYLAHLFVSPKHQGLEIGTSLLARALQHHKTEPITNRALVTFAYDPVSISLYARHGMYARDPLYLMECPKDQVKREKPDQKLNDEKLEESHAKGSILSRIDTLCVGYPRERNHEYLVGQPNVQCHLFSVGGEPVGYAYVWKNGKIGPLATVSQRVFKDTVKTSLSIATQQESPTVGLLVTGSNDALMRIALIRR
jgi:Acetyltransferase (GNAT) family